MNKRFFELFALCLLLFAFESVAQRRFRVMEYNVENLFDTIHAEGHQDEEFTLLEANVGAKPNIGVNFRASAGL